VPKIVEMETKLDLNSHTPRFTQFINEPDNQPVNTDLQDFNSSSGRKLPVSTSGKHSRRKLQVNDFVEIYFYRKDEIPSEDEPPVKSKRAKQTAEALIK